MDRREYWLEWLDDGNVMRSWSRKPDDGDMQSLLIPGAQRDRVGGDVRGKVELETMV
jgi:hypothetical protein